MNDLKKIATLPRSEMALPPSTRTQVCKFIAELVPSARTYKDIDATGKPELDELTKLLVPTVYGIKKGEFSCGHERQMLPTLRISNAGTRTVAFAPIDHITKFLASQTGKQADLAQVNDLRSRCSICMRNLTKDGIENFQSAGHSLVAGTAGPTDAVYIPAGWFFAECVQDNAAVSGMRTALLIKDAKSWVDTMREALSKTPDGESSALGKVLSSYIVGLEGM